MIRKIIHIYLYSLLLVLPSFASVDLNKTNVLLLNSYHQGYQWTDNITKAIEKELLKSLPNTRLYIEYMDTKRHIAPEYYTKLENIFSIKYENIKLAAIICSDDNAFNFVKKNNNLFNNAPIVFCGVAAIDSNEFKNHINFTGILETFDVKSNIDLVLNLHPDTRNIYYIVENTLTGREHRKVFEKYRPLYPQLNFFFLDGKDLSTQQLLDTLKVLLPKSIVFPIHWSKDKNNHFQDTKKMYPLICQTSSAPTYGLTDVMTWDGVIGGKMRKGDMIGQQSVDLLIQILEGKKPQDIPIIPETPTEYVFDYNQLVKHNIPLKLIPPTSQIMNQPFSFYQFHKSVIWFSISVVSFLLFIIFILYLIIINRRKTEHELLTSQQHYKKLIETSPDAVLLLNLDGKIQFTSEHSKLLFCKNNSISLEDKTIYDFVQESFKDTLYEIICSIETKKSLKKIELEFVRCDGTSFTGETNFSYFFNPQHSNFIIIAAIRDITLMKENEKQLDKSLKEKEILLKEIHHRVKNNMQIIHSLLNLQGSYTFKPSSDNIFNNTKNLIMSIFLVHAKIYNTEKPDEIEFSDYISSIIQHIELGQKNKPQIHMNISTVSIDLDRAIPCGLLITELINNVYSLENLNISDSITINLKKQDNHYFLSVSYSFQDEKTKNSFSPSQSSNQIITAMVSQLNGKLSFEQKKDISYQILFD